PRCARGRLPRLRDVGPQVGDPDPGGCHGPPGGGVPAGLAVLGRLHRGRPPRPRRRSARRGAGPVRGPAAALSRRPAGPDATTTGAEMDRGRVEALSDGVFAVAMTL